jgi:hypothetical protein
MSLETDPNRPDDVPAYDEDIIVDGQPVHLYASSFHKCMGGWIGAVFIGPLGHPDKCIGHVYRSKYGRGWEDHDNQFRYAVGSSLADAIRTVYFWEGYDRSSKLKRPDYWPQGFYPRNPGKGFQRPS